MILRRTSTLKEAHDRASTPAIFTSICSVRSRIFVLARGWEEGAPKAAMARASSLIYDDKLFNRIDSNTHSHHNMIIPGIDRRAASAPMSTPDLFMLYP